MPPRAVTVAILLYWVVAVSSLIRRDILPELGFVRPPDLATIARAGDDEQPVRWAVEVVNNPAAPVDRRPVGEALTRSVRNPDGGVTLSSQVWFDTGRLLKGTPFADKGDPRIEILGSSKVDPAGNLRSFQVVVKVPPDPEEQLQIVGRVIGQAIEITSKGPVPILNQTRTFPYEPRGLVQNTLVPFDRLPGLQVGQHWESRMISPLTGQVATARVEVAERTTIHWDNSPVPVLVVVHRMPPLSARTWVRPDGLVLRQEVPFPLVRLVLERLPRRTTVTSAEVTGR